MHRLKFKQPLRLLSSKLKTGWPLCIAMLSIMMMDPGCDRGDTIKSGPLHRKHENTIQSLSERSMTLKKEPLFGQEYVYRSLKTDSSGKSIKKENNARFQIEGSELQIVRSGPQQEVILRFKIKEQTEDVLMVDLESKDLALKQALKLSPQGGFQISTHRVTKRETAAETMNETTVETIEGIGASTW